MLLFVIMVTDIQGNMCIRREYIFKSQQQYNLQNYNLDYLENPFVQLKNDPFHLCFSVEDSLMVQKIV